MDDNVFLKERFPDTSEQLRPLRELYIFVDGRFLKGNDQGVSVWDHGFLYGDGVFEGLRAYDGKPFRLKAHIDRLYESAKGIQLTIPVSPEELSAIVSKTLEINHLKGAHIRIIVTRGVGGPGLSPRDAIRPSVIVMAYPMPPMLGEKPIRMMISSVRRRPPVVIDSKVKCLNYLNCILAKIQAITFGADDAFMLDMEGYLAEATGENVFLVKNQVLHTPLLTNALGGITRATVIDIADALGLPVMEKNITVQELYTADEVFVCGSAAEIVPVAEVDGRIVGDGDLGPITHKVREKFREMTQNTTSPSIKKERR